jgi:hypothetical protein
MISPFTMRNCMTSPAVKVVFVRYIVLVFFLWVAAGAVSSQTKPPSQVNSGTEHSCRCERWAKSLRFKSLISFSAEQK